MTDRRISLTCDHCGCLIQEPMETRAVDLNGDGEMHEMHEECAVRWLRLYAPDALSEDERRAAMERADRNDNFDDERDDDDDNDKDED